MATTINLGKDWTLAGLAGCSDLTVTRSAEAIDTTTRFGAKPIKKVKGGIPDYTFEGSVLATATTKFVIGESYALTVNGGTAKDVVCLTANREEPQEGVVTFKLTMKPGLSSEAANKLDVGPGDYRT
jgi:hypothetical protein